MFFHSESVQLLKAAVVLFTVLQAAVLAHYSNGQQMGQQKWMNNLADAAGILGDMLSGYDNCEYKCQLGKYKIARKGHVPRSNGCGTKDFPIQELDGYPGVTECCNKHDICYDTCNSDKSYCDQTFKDCLDMYCAASGGVKDCTQFAKMAYGGVALLGCTTYLESQKEACRCR